MFLDGKNNPIGVLFLIYQFDKDNLAWRSNENKGPRLFSFLFFLCGDDILPCFMDFHQS